MIASNATTAIATANDDNGSIMSDSMHSLLSIATHNSSTTTGTRAFDKVIKYLLRHYPQGAWTPQGKTGILPLVLAAQTGHRTWNDGMETLLHAYPPALHSRRLKIPLKLHPHVLARINGHSCNHRVREASFGSLPTVVCRTSNNRSTNAAESTNVDEGEAVMERTETAAKCKAIEQVVHPSTATTIFELLRTKPDLVSYGTSSSLSW